MSLQDSRQLENVKVLLKVGADGRGIAEIEKVGTSGVVDTYDIILSDGTRIPFDVTNGSSIATIEKTATVGLVDTYTITLTNGDTFEFNVTNADGSTAETVGYDNTSSGLDATNVQDAIDEVNDKADANTTTLGTKANLSDLTNINETGATASQAIPSGTYFYLNGTLARAKTAIASGATFTLNTNYEVVTVGEELDSLTKSTFGTAVNLLTETLPFVAPADGYIVYAVKNGSNYGLFYVNSAQIVIPQHANFNTGNMIFVRKGMIVRDLMSDTPFLIFRYTPLI